MSTAESRQHRIISLKIPFSELQSRAAYARELYSPCRVCPWKCGVNRLAGETGKCGETSAIRIAAAVPHFGEEPPLNGRNGVGNIFFSGCSLSCVYCQNWQASQQGMGDIYAPEAVADMMLKFQREGVQSVGLVTPSHYVPGALASISIAAEKGFNLPLIYNTNSWDNVETLKLLEGVIDIYLADLRYSDNKRALKYSFAENYVEISRAAVEEMFRQVGAFRGEAGRAEFGGLLVRALVLPNNLAEIWDTLCFVALELSKKIPLSLMSQYRPIYEAGNHPELDRFITDLEYNEALKMAKDLGFETIFTQELNPNRHLAPDFSRKGKPFGEGGTE